MLMSNEERDIQELLAPPSLQFFSKEGNRIGDKQSLEHQIHDITEIPVSALQGSALSQFSPSQKFDWAKNRRTTREEDWAYCLLGIFEVSMAVIYGEGKKNAVTRLRKVIDNASKDNKECLRHLYVTDPHKDKIRIEGTKGGLISDSYHWILENHDFKEWRDGLQSHLLWIKGDPGKGKTMLVCGIIDELKSIDETHLLSFFFCQATDSRINNATAVLRGLLYMLIDQQPSLILHIQKQHDHAGKTLFEDANAWVALSDIFTSVLQDPNLKNTYLIIDALDECTVGRENLLDFISQKSPAFPHIKWLVSSRNWTSIEERLGKAGSKKSLSLELNSESVSMAVSIYIQHKVRELAQEKNYDDKTRDVVLDHLFSNANDTFLWVALVCENLKNIPRGRTRAKLDSFPPGLDSVYERIMKQISESEDSELCKRILASIATVYEPITVFELASIVEILEESSDDLESLKEIVGLCGSFLVIRDDAIYFVHQSAKDYLEKASVDIFPSGRGEIHYETFSRSLVVLSGTLRRNIYGLSSVGCPIELVKQPDPDPLMAARYSCVYWVDHLCDWSTCCSADQQVDMQDGGVVHMFMRKKFLYWLEALSLCGSMSKGVVAMAKLEALIEERTNDLSLVEPVKDARRFIMHNKQAIEASPLQAYVSKLLFSPASSLIRRWFKKEEPVWISIMPALRNEWGACLQTLEGHRNLIDLVTFSQDSTRLASTSDREIKVWDARSGDCLSTLDCDDEIKSIIFSHTSAELLSVSEKGSVQVWNVSSGDCLQMLETHSGGLVSSVAFSHDLTRLGLASQGRSVQFWDVNSGNCLQTLEGYCDSFGLVVFSDDSTKIASTLQGSIIKVWDIYSRQCLLTLDGHSDQAVESLSFSPDSTQPASVLMYDQGIKVWDLSSGDCLQTFTGFRGEVLSVAFSYTLKPLVLTRQSGVVKVWDTRSGKCLRTLTDDGAWHSPVTLSSSLNPTQVALVSRGRVKVWNIDDGECLQTLEGHNSRIEWITFSKQANLLASVTEDTIKIWNINSGKCLQTLEDHSYWAHSVIFSQDSTQLASITKGIVKVWNIHSGECLQTLEGHSSSFNSVAFSQDSTLLLSDIGSPIVEIRDLSNSQCLQTLEGHSSPIDLVAFSHDSTRLASASKKSVRIWNIDSGECVQTIERHNTWLDHEIAITNDLTRLASLSDEAVEVWDIDNGECLQTLEDHERRHGCMIFSHDSARLASALYMTINVWNVGNGELSQTLEGHRSMIHSITFSSDSTRLASASSDCTVKIWDISSAKYPASPISTASRHSDRVRAVSLSYDSTQLVSASNDRTINLWHVSSGECLRTFKGHDDMVNLVAFSYDSTQLISGSVDGTIMVWDTGSGECLWTLKGHSNFVCSIALPYKQNRLASVSDDLTVKVWDLSSGTNIHTFKDHEDHINAVAFSHDSTRLAVASDDNTIRIWDANNGECLQILKGHSDMASSVAFSYDSTRLASSSADGTVRIWDARSSECLRMLDIGRDLDNISFDTSGSYLYTDIGAFAVDAQLTSKTKPDQLERQNPRCVGVGLSPNREWITYNSEKFVWLPPEYRPSCSAVLGSTIGIGNASGKVWMCTLQVASHEQ